MTPAELWEKHYSYASMNGDYMSKPQFLAALKEYGEVVRKRDAEIARELHAGEQDDITRDAKFRSAASIEREPLI